MNEADRGVRNNFILLLAISLIVSSISSLTIVLQLDNFIKTFLTLYGISAIITSIFFFLKKDVPRTFGFINLTVFMFLDGINVEIFAFNPDSFPRSYFAVNGIIALASGIFFATKRQTWKNFGFIMLSGYLIMTAAAGINAHDDSLAALFLGISILFATPAAVFFFLRKEQDPVR